MSMDGMTIKRGDILLAALDPVMGHEKYPPD